MIYRITCRTKCGAHAGYTYAETKARAEQLVAEIKAQGLDAEIIDQQALPKRGKALARLLREWAGHNDNG